MHEFQIIMVDGTIMTGFGYVPEDMHRAMDEAGYNAYDIAQVSRVSKHSPAAEGDHPYVEMTLEDAALAA